MITRFYRRSGERISRAKVRAARLAHAASFRIGKRFGAPCAIQPRMAEAFERMTDEQFATETGGYTYVRKEQ
jgi:hypothetical protein